MFYTELLYILLQITSLSAFYIRVSDFILTTIS
jgi:hypothetical protein